MKRIILPFIALFAAISLSIPVARAQGIEMLETPDYVGKDGGSYITSFILTGHRSAPVIPPPIVEILGDEFIYMKAISCSFDHKTERGYVYELRLEIGAAVDFGETVNSHIQLLFEFDYNYSYDVDFWTIQSGLSVGGISPLSQNTAYWQTSQKLTYSSKDISSIRSVQWQRKVDSGSWIDIPGATQYTYSPGGLPQTTEFRVLATSTGSGREYTAPAIINVSPRFDPGTILGNQTIIPGYVPATITNLTLASGGSSPITYQWQSCPDNRNWIDIPGATSESYQPSALTAKTFFRRQATSGTEIQYSNSIEILMKAQIAEYLSFKPVVNVVSEKDRDNRTRGLKTYEKVAVLGGDVEAFVERVFYYDYQARVIQIVEKNQLGGISRYSTKYDFTGNVLKNHEQHGVGAELTTPDSDDPRGESHQKLAEFTYDHRGRLMTEKTTLNNGEPAMVAYTYDQLGRLIGKTYGNPDEPRPESITLARIPVGTNIRGWTFRRDRANTYDVVYASGFYLYPDGVVKLTTTNGFEIEAYTEAEDWIWNSMTVRINGNTRYLMKSGIWLDLDAPDYDTFIVPNDKDYIVTSNTLPDGGTMGYWGFDRIAKVEIDPYPRVITETYDYNIQGWLSGKSSPHFDMKFHYYDPQNPDSSSSYTGNISECGWTHNDLPNATSESNTYAFTYDKLNRLTDTKQYISGALNDQFVEKGLSYDYNGNIQRLQRYAGGALSDNFSYTYSGNQLASISGTSTGSYTYDSNGNMTHDGLNNHELTYNRLNLTEKVSKNGVAVANYCYLWDGTKVSVRDSDGNGLFYLGSLVYKKQGTVFSLESAGFSSGRLVVSETRSGTISKPNYFLTDHLGSVRVVLDNEGVVNERNDYYPYGMRWDAGRISYNRYHYNGKEDQSFVGVPYTDYGARMYDSKYRLTWNGRDMLAEKYYLVSSYAFCNNNPVKNVDPDGRDWYSYERKYIDEDGNEQTKTVYTYSGVQLSNKEMKEGGYMHLGYTHTDRNGKYYSLLGEVKDIKTDEGRLHSLIDNAIINNYTSREQDIWSSEPAYEPATDFTGIKQYQKNAFGSGNNIYRYPNSYVGADVYFVVNQQNMKGVYVPPGNGAFGKPNYMPGGPNLPAAYYAYIRQKNTTSGNIIYLPFRNAADRDRYQNKINKLFPEK